MHWPPRVQLPIYLYPPASVIWPRCGPLQIVGWKTNSPGILRDQWSTRNKRIFFFLSIFHPHFFYPSFFEFFIPIFTFPPETYILVFLLKSGVVGNVFWVANTFCHTVGLVFSYMSRLRVHPFVFLQKVIKGLAYVVDHLQGCRLKSRKIFMTWKIPIFEGKHSWNSQKILDCRAKILLNLNHLSILAAREMTVHFCKRSYFALVIEVVSYEKGSDCHPHLLIGPLNTTIPSIPAKSSDFIHSINPQHKQDYFHISTFSQNWASKIKIFSAKIQMDLF